jgi:hypothetical protein
MHKVPRPTHACAVSMHWVGTLFPVWLSGMQKQVDGSVGFVWVHGKMQLSSDRAHLQSMAKHCAGSWQPVTMMPWSGTEITEPHAPVAATSATAAATPRVQRMGRHLAVAFARKASPIGA